MANFAHSRSFMQPCERPGAEADFASERVFQSGLNACSDEKLLPA